ncbi:TetR/AcrR family transcriptional regulator [Singulisphaera sp. PoT]|uniref:TetR/AcrR family transcriptional regulator n=1 Tax=Singulisphaera sp. PoT TaxID=3411797 RepID=UPI003BF60590
MFRERGYGQTTATEIAALAGVTERTFFRHFEDKREVLFDGSDDLCVALVERILQAPDVVWPLQVVIGVLAEFDWESLGSRDFHRQRHAVIAANPELLERDLIKQRSIAVGFTDALRQRGVDADVALLAARIGLQIFITAYEQWIEADEKADLATISKTAMSLLATIAPIDVSRGSPRPGEQRFRP